MFWLAAVLFVVSPARAATYTAASCGRDDVNAVINGPTHVASDGDTILIPAGTCTWTKGIAVPSGIGISIIGAGTSDPRNPSGSGATTTIIDNYTTKPSYLFYFRPIYGASLSRISSLTLSPQPGLAQNSLMPVIAFQGTCTASGCPDIRVDHLLIPASPSWAGLNPVSSTLIVADNVFGVLDHNSAYLDSSGSYYEFVNFNHSAWQGIGQFGDHSWASPSTFGTHQALYVESNYFETHQNILFPVTESEGGFGYTRWGGGRVVCRFNTGVGLRSMCVNHGTESGGRMRGGRQMEFYKNSMSCPSSAYPACWNNGMLLGAGPRSGSLLAIGNRFTGRAINSFASVVDYRVLQYFGPWHACDGTGPYDDNDPTTYFTGTIASVSGSNTYTITVNGNPGWTPNQWVVPGTAYSVHDATINNGSEIRGNGSNTLTVTPWTTIPYAPGDTIQIRRAYACIDQPGRIGGSLLAGETPVPNNSEAGWQNQTLEPVYEAADTSDQGAPVFGPINSNSARIIANRDYYGEVSQLAQTSPTSPFNGTVGTGYGALAYRPATCTAGVGYWATDQGAWNESGAGGQGQLYVCTAPNTWSLYYVPYTYPHPLVSRAPGTTRWVSPDGAAAWTQCLSDADPGAGHYCSLGAANANAAAGDTIFLKGGTYLLTQAGESGIAPVHSGTSAQNRLTYAAAPGEEPVIKGSGCYDCGWGLVLSHENQYIKVDGIAFLNLARWATLTNRAHHNEISNCTFRSETGEEVVGGFFIGGRCSGGARLDCYSTHNWVHDNVFSKAHGDSKSPTSCYEGRDLVRIGDPYNAGYPAYVDANNNNTLEDNVMEYGGHALLDTYGQYTVIRGNVMHNEAWIPDTSGGTCAYPPMPGGRYGHRVMQVSEDFGRDGTYTLIESNRMGPSSANPNNPGEAVLSIAAPKNIVRFNSIFAGQQSGIYFKYASNGRPGGGGTGSINNRVYSNTLFHNGWSYPYMQAPQASCSTCPGKLAGITLYSATIGNILKNNIAYDSYSYSLSLPAIYPGTLYTGLDITVDSGKNPADYPAIVQLANNWTTVKGDPKFVNPDLSDPTSKTLPDLNLRPESPAIDQGAPLTTAVGLGKNTTRLMVVDALYFQDGSWGSDLARGTGFFPDWIAVGSPLNAAPIAAINYATNVMTLKTPISWNDQAPVWLYRNSAGKRVLFGAAPDAGSSEYCAPGECAAADPRAPSTYYVDKAHPAANDSNPGTEAAPWRTVKKGADTAKASDTVVVKAGAYDERITIKNSGLAGSPIVFQGQSGAKVKGFTLINRSYVTIQGFEITHEGLTPEPSPGSSGTSSLFVSTGSHIQILNNWIHDTEGACILLYGLNPRTASNDSLIQGNIMAHCGRLNTSGGGAGIAVYGSRNRVENNDISHNGEDFIRMTGGDFNVIRNNHLHDNSWNDWPGTGTHIDGIQNWCSETDGLPMHHALIENNRMTDSTSDHTHFVLFQDYGSCGNSEVIIRGNTVKNIGSGFVGDDRSTANIRVYHNTAVDIAVAHDPKAWTIIGSANQSPGLKIINNLFYNAVRDGGSIYTYDDSSAAGFLASHNLGYNSACGSTCLWYNPKNGIQTDPAAILNRDPLFADYGLSDLSLQTNSPAKNKGGALTQVSAGDAGSGLLLRVEDAGYFQDGWAGVAPDGIAVGTTANKAQIVSIDYVHNILTLDRSILRTPRAPVWLFSDSNGRQVLSGSAPDIGASHYSSVAVPPVNPPSTDDPLVPFDLSSLDGRTFRLGEEIGFSYSVKGVTFDWAFASVSSLSSSPPVAAGNDDIRSMRANAPIPTTSVPRFTPGSLGLTPGGYVLTVTVSKGGKSFSAQARVTLVASSLSAVKVYPNPWRSDRHAGFPSVTFAGLTVGTTIKIFTLSGREVKELHTDGPSSPWDLTNDSGDKVASGVYLYVITDTAGDKVRGKVAVIK